MAQETILVIDDEPAIVKIIQLHLEKKGYKVAVAYDGAEGLACAKRVKPDLVILDVGMPRKNGFEFYNEIVINNREKMFPVIVLTGRPELESLFREIHVDAFVAKPVNFSQLIRQVERVLAIKNGHPEFQAVGKNVLVVDREDRMLDTLVALFVRGGFDVHCVKSLSEIGLQMPREPLDYMLVSLSSFDLIDSLRKVPGLTKDATEVWLYTPKTDPVSPDTVKELCDRPGIAPAKFVVFEEPADLLRKACEPENPSA